MGDKKQKIRFNKHLRETLRLKLKRRLYKNEKLYWANQAKIYRFLMKTLFLKILGELKHLINQWNLNQTRSYE